MATIISAQTSGVGGAAITGDSSGILQFASNNGVTAVSIATDQTVTIPKLFGTGSLNPSINTIVTSATITPTANTCSQYNVTAQATGAAIAAPSGSSYDGQKLTIRIKDNGTAQILSWNAAYRAVGLTLPTTTNASGVLYVGCIYNTQNTVWDVVAVAQL
jgi:hypothetical protein